MAKRKYAYVSYEMDKTFVRDKYDKIIKEVKATSKDGSPLEFNQDGSIKTNPIIIETRNEGV